MENRRERLQVETPEVGNLTYELKHTPWKARLHELGTRWLPSTPENSAAFLAQVNEAWGLAYIYIWSLNGRAGQYAGYTDDERNSAAIHMGKALKGYDPARQDLDTFVEQKAKLLLKGAWARGLDIEYDSPEVKDDPDAWNKELAELEGCADGSEEWVESTADIVYSHYHIRIGRKYQKKEERTELLAGFRELLQRFSPKTGSLAELVQDWERLNLGTDSVSASKKGRMEASLDAPMGEDGDAAVTFVESKGADPAVISQVSTDTHAAMIALILNFRELLKGWNRDRAELIHNRMFYTEQITSGILTKLPPPGYHRDILRAVYGPYLRYFAENVPERMTIEQLLTLEPKPHGSVIPGKRMDEPVPYDKNGFLPIKAQSSFLRSLGIRADNKAYEDKIYRYRNRYRRSIGRERAE